MRAARTPRISARDLPDCAAICGGARVARFARVLAERFRTIRPLGEGSMGVVHLVEDRTTGMQVALKVLPKELASNLELAGRLAREAVATQAIDHANVARAIEAGTDPDGTAWLVLEYVDGRSLREALSAGALHPVRSLKIVRQILLALAAAHGKGVVHRDIKPENVMLIAREGFDDETVKVLDFGIAKLDQRHQLTGPQTNAGVVYGTPTYMAPEQVRREPVDGRTDLYALGVMLFEMVAGSPPFHGDDITVLARHLTLPAPPISSPVAPESLTLAVRAFVARLLAKNPDARFATADDALAALDESLAAMHQDKPIESGMRTGATLIPKGSLPPAPLPSTATPLQKKTAKLVAFARSYGLTPPQLLFAFAVAIGLILVVTVVAMATS
jgi:eukaryotic-like serine/threonine-protein kinase